MIIETSLWIWVGRQRVELWGRLSQIYVAFTFLSRGSYVEGPLGFPVKELVARELEGLFKDLPKDSAYEYRRLARSPPRWRWNRSSGATCRPSPGTCPRR